MWHGYYHAGGWPMYVGGALFWGSIIAVGVWVIHRVTRRGDAETPYSQGRTPLETLKGRYARGEIIKQEFEEIKRDLLS